MKTFNIGDRVIFYPYGGSIEKDRGTVLEVGSGAHSGNFYIRFDNERYPDNPNAQGSWCNESTLDKEDDLDLYR